jgi:5-methylcytosine-specific restriction endonuclease McrBC regulatory subunit McrC
MEKITSKPLTLDLIGDEHLVPDWYKPIRFVLLIIYYHYMASDKDGDKPLYKLSDRERLCWIYEKFVRNYCAYKYAATGKLYVSNGEYYVRRKSGYRKCEIDLLLESQTNALIVDMKWYENPQNRSSPENMRQLYDYMNGYNQRFYGRHYEMSHVNGLLLYADARTSEENWEFYGDSSKVYWQTIGLDQDWDKLTSDLDTILLGYLKNEEHP